MRQERKTTESEHRRSSEPTQESGDTSTTETRNPQEREGPGALAETKGQDPESLEGPQRTNMFARICWALRFQICRVMLEWGIRKPTSAGTQEGPICRALQSLIHDLSRDDVAFPRDGFAERAQNGQRVSVRSPTCTPDDRGCKKCSDGEKRRCVGRSGQVWLHNWFVCSKTRPAGRAEQVEMSRAVQELPKAEVRTSAGLRSVPGTRPGTSVSAVLSRGVHNCGDRVVAACGLAQSEHVAWASRLAGSAGHKVRRSPSAGVPSQRTAQAPTQLRDDIHV